MVVVLVLVEQAWINVLIKTTALYKKETMGKLQVYFKEVQIGKQLFKL